MKLLIIEDEASFVQRIVDACLKSGTIDPVKPDEIGLTNEFSDRSPIEEQLVERLRDVVKAASIDMVLLDTDLSREQGRLRSQSEYRQAFQSIGIPVCRYRKGQSTTQLAKLDQLRRLVIEGASAIWVDKELVSPDSLEPLISWLTEIHQGFSDLAGAIKAIQDSPDLDPVSLGPAGILALALNRPDLKADLLGYTAQNFFFFATSSDDEASHWATQLGYWLHNYILQFPGPILNPAAAAAYLNLSTASFEIPEVRELVSHCRYAGPFGGLNAYYWRQEIGLMLDALDGDIANAPELSGKTLTRVNKEQFGTAYYCILTGEPIAPDEAAPNPDWIPAGAQLARIRESDFDALGPMLSI